MCCLKTETRIDKYHWPAFNVADSGITVGVTIFLLLQIFEGEENKQEATAENA
jgi:lipoprotein signal peptidase